MKLHPYLRVDDTPFATTRAQIEAARGLAPRTVRYCIGLTALDYGDVVFRFQESTGRLEEVTRRAPVLYVQGPVPVIDVPFAGLARFVRAHDAEAFMRAGFVVSPRWGLAFVPGEPDWVTALAAHCIATWRAL